MRMVDLGNNATIRVKDEPWLPDEELLKLASMGDGCWQAVANFGYQETPSMDEIFQASAEH